MSTLSYDIPPGTPMVLARTPDDPRLSWKAKGIIGVLSTRKYPGGVSFLELESLSKDGCHALREGLKELIKYGYLGAMPWVHPRGLSREVRCKVLRRDGYTCIECGISSFLEIDHIVPVARGGSDHEDNLCVRRADCNRSKGAKTP